MVEKQKIIGGSVEGSPRATERLESFSLAQQALEKADVKELFALYEKAVKDRGEIESALETVIHHYMGEKDHPRIHSEDTISSMEHVALAAIELAKSVALEVKKK